MRYLLLKFGAYLFVVVNFKTKENDRKLMTMKYFNPKWSVINNGMRSSDGHGTAKRLIGMWLIN